MFFKHLTRDQTKALKEFILYQAFNSGGHGKNERTGQT